MRLTFCSSAPLALLFAAAAPALADSPFDGTWKAQVSSIALQAKPDSFQIKNGVYTCSSCTPAAYSVPADGAYHAVKGKDYWDDVAITVVDDHSAKFSFRKNGKVISDNAYVVSPDGATLTMTAHNTNNGGSVPVDSSVSETRIGAPVAGAHLISGQWKSAPPTSVSDQAMMITMAVSDGMLHLKTGLGETLDAKVGGDYAPDVGDPGKTMTKVAQLGPRTLQLTDMRAGKVTEVSTYTIQDDGTLKGSWRDLQDGSTGGFTATKQ